MTMVQQRPPRMLGPGHDTFWEWCAKGELRLPRCMACGALHWPVVKACEHCGKDAFDWAAMSGRGTVASWCSVEQDYLRGLMPPPIDTILVELEEGVLFLSNPQGFTWRDIAIGMPVRLAFIDCEDQAGAFRLPVFERG